MGCDGVCWGEVGWRGGVCRMLEGVFVEGVVKACLFEV